MMSDEPAVQAINELIEQIRPLLADKGPRLQGAALASLLAIWLSGHTDSGGERRTALMRAELLSMHLEAVRALLVLEDKLARAERPVRRRH